MKTGRSKVQELFFFLCTLWDVKSDTKSRKILQIINRHKVLLIYFTEASMNNLVKAIHRENSRKS